MPSSRLWDPRNVLGISRDGRCVGVAPSKKNNSKCTVPISAANLSNADTLIESIAREEPDTDALSRKLCQLASLLLCRRWHQSQVEDMVEEWVTDMRSKYPDGEVVRRRRGQPSTFSRNNLSSSSSTSSASSSPSRSSRQSTSSVSSVSTTPTSVEYESIEGSMAILREILRDNNRDYRSSHPSSGPIPTVSNGLSPITSNTSAQNRPQSSTVRGGSSITSTRLPAQVPTSSFTSTAHSQSRTTTSPSPASTIRSQDLPSVSSSDRNANTDVEDATSPEPLGARRRAIDDECTICMDDFQSNDLILWCKAGCGRSVHSSCFEGWEETCIDDERSVTCVFCRAGWEEQSAILFKESNPCTRTHVRRLGNDEECPICQEDYSSDESTTWCKDGCGRTVHRDCFEEWQKHLDENQTSVSCIFCRRAWESDCECNE